MKDIVGDIKKQLEENNGKINFEFINTVAEKSTKILLHPTKNMRICILILESGHEVIGVAQVLDSKNDVEEIGNSVAYENAVNELWKVCGNIAKAI